MVDKVADISVWRCRKILPAVYVESLSYVEQLMEFCRKLNECIELINGIGEDILDQAKAYTDSEIAKTFEEVDRKIAELEQLIRDTEHDFEELVNDTIERFNNAIDALNNQYQEFTDDVEHTLDTFEGRIDYLDNKLDTEIEGVINRTDIMIQQNNEYLIDEIVGNLPSVLKVYNILEGGQMTIQEMFNYLCELHIADGIDIDTLASRNLTVNDIIAINRSVRDCVMYGNTILV